MASLTGIEKRRLERLFSMESGYVLDFSDRTFGEFFHDYLRLDIDQDKYRANGTSKANRLRTFWALENDFLVAKSIDQMISYGDEESALRGATNELIEECRDIAQRLRQGVPVAELDYLTATTDEKDFEAVANHIRDLIEKNEPETALDRLHTFVIKYIRTLCEQRGITVTRDKALHSIFGELVRKMRDAGQLEAAMTERILKSSISVLEAFNDVRNNQSLAHDNPILNYEEALLIFNHVAASTRFIKSLEDRRSQ